MREAPITWRYSGNIYIVGEKSCVLSAQGPAFDLDARRAQGPVLSWIDRLLKAPPPQDDKMGPSKRTVAHSALLNLLQSNLDLFDVFVDRCYDGDPRVAKGYFKVGSDFNLSNCFIAVQVLFCRLVFQCT